MRHCSLHLWLASVVSTCMLHKCIPLGSCPHGSVTHLSLPYSTAGSWSPHQVPLHSGTIGSRSSVQCHSGMQSAECFRHPGSRRPRLCPQGISHSSLLPDCYLAGGLLGFYFALSILTCLAGMMDEGGRQKGCLLCRVPSSTHIVAGSETADA